MTERAARAARKAAREQPPLIYRAKIGRVIAFGCVIGAGAMAVVMRVIGFHR